MRAFLTALALLIGGGMLAPTMGRANTVITCTGTETITTNSWVVFDNAARTCTITDTAPATVNGNFFFAGVPDDIFQPTAAFAIFIGGTATDSSFESCTVGATAKAPGSSCSNGFDGANGAFTGSYEVIVNGTRIRMEVAFTANDTVVPPTLDITSATVTIFDGATTVFSAEDKAKITDSLLNTLNSVGGGSIFDTDGESIFGDGSTPGLSLAPGGLAYAATRRALGDPDNPFDRAFGAIDDTPIGLRGLERGNDSFNFRFDLTQMARASANGGDVLGVDKSSKTAPRSPFNVWFSGSYVDFKDRNASTGRDGHVWWITGGVSYQITGETKIGVFTRVRQGEVSSAALTSSLDSDFWGGGAFVVHQFGYGVRAMGAVRYEVGDNSVLIAGASGRFNSGRLAIDARLDKRFAFDRYWIEPAVSVLYARDSRVGYTDSSGAIVAGSDWTLGRLSYGPKLGTTLFDIGQIKSFKPYVKVNGIWDFEHLGDATLTTGVVLGNASSSVNLGGGTEVVFINGMMLSLAGDWYGFNSEFSAWSFTGSFGAPMSALGVFGFVPNGVVSLNMTMAEQNVGAKMRLTVTNGR